VIGKTLGHYEILDALGAGGMGEVYRARDTKLGRDVAIKVLPEPVAADAELLARFEREARLLASLNHANIAAIYGLEHDDGIQYIVMEVVEGETLEERIERAGALDPDDAVDIARQIAVGLEAAHDSGVVHRDLKPANIKITAGGDVKILDFGLATSHGAAGDADGTDPSNSPTMLAATGAGIVMGTAAYMSPEQAKGLRVDKRTDIWAFGVVLYEMLAGAKLFEAETVTDVLADVLRAPLDLRGLPARTPARLRALIARCLDRNPKTRLRDIGEARVVLSDPAVIEAASGRGDAIGQGTPLRPGPGALLGMAAVATLLVIVTALITRSLTATAPQRVARVLDIVVDAAPAPGTALSPDGTRLAYWRRGADLVVQDLVTGALTTVFSREDPTGGYGRPYWSLDGQELAVTSAGAVLVMAAEGGDLRVAAETGRGLGGLSGWGPDDTVLLRTDEGIEAVPSSGGDGRLLIPAEEEWRYQSPPVFLPDGSALFIAHAADGEPGLYVHVNGGTGLLRRLPAELEFGRLYFGGGNWLVADAGLRAEPALWAIPFDASRVRSEGDPVRVLPGARSPTMSDEGALVYVDAEVFSSEYDVVWVSREGTVQETVRPSEAKRPLGAPLISPDGQRMAVVVTDNDAGEARGGRGAATTRSLELLVYDFATPGAPILLYAGADFGLVGWFPDSQHVVVGLSGEDGLRLVAMPLEGGGDATPIATARAGRGGRGGLIGSTRPAMTPGGERLTYLDSDGVAQMVTIARDGTVSAPQPLVAERAEGNGGITVSPDGKLAATSSSGSTDSTLALTRLPAGTPTFPLASNARSPRWSRDGSELFFYQASSVATSYIMSVGIDLAAGRPTGAPVQLFPTTVGARQYLLSGFDVAPDRNRFLMVLLRQPPTRHVLIEDFDAFMQARRR